MKNRIAENCAKEIVPDTVHGRELPYPIRTFSDEGNAYRYFLARYRNYFREFEKTASADELWTIKADLLAIIHSFSTPNSEPELDAGECVATIDVLFCQTCPDIRMIPQEPPVMTGTRMRL